MTKAEMKTKFATLHGVMSSSRKVSNMKLFGSVMCDMMDNIIEHHPEQAEQYIERLCAVKWNNYLTEHEAREILERMTPEMEWDYDTFVDAVTNHGGRIEYKPCYNRYALWVTMNMIYSDSAETIAEIMGRTLDNVPDSMMINAVYKLATDKLCDEDQVFNIRTYFNV